MDREVYNITVFTVYQCEHKTFLLKALKNVELSQTFDW